MNKDRNKSPLRVLALASFLHDMGSDMVFSVWPLFVTSVLGANMAVLGLIDGLGEAVVSISQAGGGYISDKTNKRKLYVWMGYFFGGIARLGYAFSPNWGLLIPFRMIDRSGKLRTAPRDAIVAEISTDKDRGKNFGILRAMDNYGAVVGVLLSIILVDQLGYRNIFFLAALPSLLAVILLIAFLREHNVGETKIFKGLGFKQLDKNLLLFTILSTIFALGSFSYSFLLLAAKNLGFPNTAIPGLYLLFTLVEALTSVRFGKLADFWGRKTLLLISYGLWALVPAIFILFKNITAVIVAFIAYGLHKGAFDPVQRTFVAELAPAPYLASTIGMYQMLIGICTLPASLLAGILWLNYGPVSPFYFSLLMTIMSLILLLFVKRK